MAALDWSQCSAVESVPGRLNGAWVFRDTRPDHGVAVRDIRTLAADGIPPTINGADEHIPAIERIKNGARQGRNGFGEIGYGGPQPPSGTHRYFFHLYALDSEPQLDAGASREEVERAIRGHILAERT
jgi:hypothetical protein